MKFLSKRRLVVISIVTPLLLIGILVIIFLNLFPTYKFVEGQDSLLFRHPRNWDIPYDFIVINSHTKILRYQHQGNLFVSVHIETLPKISSCGDQPTKTTYCKMVTFNDYQRLDTSRVVDMGASTFYTFERRYEFADRSYNLSGLYIAPKRNENIFLKKELEQSVRSFKYITSENTNILIADKFNRTSSPVNVNSFPIDVSNWILYTDELFKVNFRYPKSYKVIFSSDQGDSTYYPIYGSVTYLHDLPQKESEYQGMAGNISSQEMFNKLKDDLNLEQPDHLSVGSDKAQLYIGGNENSQLIKQYRIIHDNYIVTFTADAGHLLKKENLGTEKFAENGYQLSQKAPQDVKDFFANFDLVVQSVDLSNLKSPEVAGSFSENAIPKKIKVFDDCGKLEDYSKEDWYQRFADRVGEDGERPESITDICFSASENFVIATMPGGYCQPGNVLRYSINDGSLTSATFLNEYQGCVTSPSLFGKRIGNYIEMSGEIGDAGCGRTVYFQYDFQNNLVRKYKSESFCYGPDGEKSDESLQEFY